MRRYIGIWRNAAGERSIIEPAGNHAVSVTFAEDTRAFGVSTCPVDGFVFPAQPAISRLMREGSREQTGCFLAMFMIATAGFAVRAILRAASGPPDPDTPAATSTHLLLVFALAVVFIVLALFALKLKKWALVTYAVTSVIAIALSLRVDLPIVIPLLIGLCGVGAVSFARRDVI